MPTKYDGRPGLDWGPFVIAMIVTGVLLVMSAGVVIAAVHVSLWLLLALVATLPLAAMCFASGIGVLYAQRRQWERARSAPSMSRDRGWRSYGEEI